MTGSTLSTTSLALIAFAANSILCRLALGGGSIDAASFTSIRIISGALVLFLVSRLTETRSPTSAGNWKSALALTLYAVPFSFAYLELPSGTGALILFGSVQMTMLCASFLTGERLRGWQWLGLLSALLGLSYLVSPGLEAPSLSGSILMTLSGIAWGSYSLWGKERSSALLTTTGNFLRAVPVVILINLFTLSSTHLESAGVILAIIAGAITSGLGYAIWYAALKGLSKTQASVLQLAVPVIATIGGFIFLSEELNGRILISSAAILGGIGLILRNRKSI